MRTKVIEGHENYKISDTGRIFNITTDHELKPIKNSYGYLRVNLDGKCCRIHRLVGFAFVKNPNPKKFKEINHLNGLKDNNNYQNLEWTDRSGNMKHAYETGLENSIKFRGSNNVKAKLTDDQVHEICRLFGKGIGATEIARMMGKPSLKTIIQHIKNRQSWCHISKDYKFSTDEFLKPRLTENQVHEVCKKIEKGMGAAEIAKSLGDSTLRKSIQQIKSSNYWADISKLYDFSKAKRNNKLTDTQVHKICDLLETGMGVMEIAKNFGNSALKQVIQAIKDKRSWKKVSKNYNF